MEYGVKWPAGPFVIFEIFIEYFHGWWIWEKIEEPIWKEDEPDEPKRDTFSEMRLELNNFINTFPVVVMDA